MGWLIAARSEGFSCGSGVSHLLCSCPRSWWRWYLILSEYNRIGSCFSAGARCLQWYNRTVSWGLNSVDNQSHVSSAWAFALAIAPLVGGSLANNNNWRWLFCMRAFTNLKCILTTSFRSQSADLWRINISSSSISLLANSSRHIERETWSYGLDVGFDSSSQQAANTSKWQRSYHGEYHSGSACTYVGWYKVPMVIGPGSRSIDIRPARTRGVCRV